MYLQEVIIDGFKSYSQRTVITGWDPQFNAITGLNGSGKSNILDAICFVLGISNLSQVRASNLQDLVYKQGQAGVTKATVTLVFNNSDPQSGPVGYDHCETITVARQVIIGGRNKYMINGHTVQASQVANLFHSVQLNVNNPHFLIMQGRITKVLNMKPPEILGLIEETAGTRMFETKKQSALKTIEKKDAKVQEISNILANEITPTLERLRAERAAYLKWAANNTEVERLAKFCVAWDYAQIEQSRTNAGNEINCLQEQVSKANEDISGNKDTLAKKEKEIKATEAKLLSKKGGSHQLLVEKENALSKAFVQATAVYNSANAHLENAKKDLDGLKSTLLDSEAQVQQMEKEFEEETAKVQDMEKENEEVTKLVAELQTKLTATVAGMSIGEQSSGSITERLSQARQKSSALQSEIKQREMKVRHLESVVREASQALKREEEQSKGAVERLKKVENAVSEKRKELDKLVPMRKKLDDLQAEREKIVSEIQSYSEKHESEWYSLQSLVDFSYERAGLGPNFSPDSVKGTVAKLVTVKRTDAALALQIAAGGRLYQVIVDTDSTGKLLLSKGRLRRRVTLIPLNQIRSNPLSKNKISTAVSISKGAATPALDLLDFDPGLVRAMEYVFGSTFICENPNVAKLVCFDDRVKAPCVTLSGDMFDPSGTLEGGSAPNSADGEPFLLKLQRVNELGERLEQMKNRLTAIEDELATFSKGSSRYAVVADELEIATTELDILQKRIESSTLGQAKHAFTEAQEELKSETESIASAKAKYKEVSIELKDLEREESDAEAARSSRIASVEAELSKALKDSKKKDEMARKMRQSLDTLRYSLDSLISEKTNVQNRCKEQEAAMSIARDEVHEKKVLMDEAEKVALDAKSALDTAVEEIAQADKKLREMVQERDEITASIDELKSQIRIHESKIQSILREAQIAERRVADLLLKHPWINTEKAFFNKPHSDYDFVKNDAAAAHKRLSELETAQAALERNINKKVMGMIDTAEREYADLMTKKLIVENDKEKISKVIAELDEKKNETLRTTWAKVNKDFGSIFSLLLPGTTAKLEAPEGGTILDGLVVKVAFNNVWKESLTELSGGQRSLLALSLILALLLIKPAPMYILDEVDAALDMSHTQNIGAMIRKHFAKSQFIVVSLKPGMFSNANVIFRTKFVDGTSTVTRTVTNLPQIETRSIDDYSTEQDEEMDLPKQKVRKVK